MVLHTCGNLLERNQSALGVEGQNVRDLRRLSLTNSEVPSSGHSLLEISMALFAIRDALFLLNSHIRG